MILCPSSRDGQHPVTIAASQSWACLTCNTYGLLADHDAGYPVAVDARPLDHDRRVVVQGMVIDVALAQGLVKREAYDRIVREEVPLVDQSRT